MVLHNRHKRAIRPQRPPPHEKPRVPHRNPDNSIILAFTIVSLLTRLFRIQHPAAIVFDELHFTRFLHHHLTRKFAFDIHPWLGKLTIAFFAWLTGYRVTEHSYEVATKYPSSGYVLARLPGALFGSFVVPVAYMISRELRLSQAGAILAALLALFDNLLLVESRLVLVDPQMMFYLQLSLLLALKVWRMSERCYGGARYYKYLIGTAAAAAAAISVKWTAAVTPFLIICVCALGIVFLTRPMPIRDCALAALVAGCVYVVPWYVHLRVSTMSTVDAVHMGDRFRSTLMGNTSFPYDPEHNVSFTENLYELHWRQFRANQKVKTRHHWESRWYEWPLNQRGIYYFVDRASTYTDAKPIVRVIYLLQNPATAVWITASVASFLIMLPVVHRYRTMIPARHAVFPLVSKATFLLAGYVLNLVPYMFVERCYFLYHYLPASAYGQLLVALLVDSLPRRIKFVGMAVVGFSVFAAFVFWAPWVYCLPIDYEGIARRQWMPRWT